MANASEPDSGCGAACTCGAPGRSQFVTLSAPPASSSRVAGGGHAIEQAHVPAGVFTMGDSSGDRNPGDGETPLHDVDLDAFDIDATTVTNDDFARFTESTGYRTEA